MAGDPEDRPDRVPGGTFTLTGLEFRVGTATVVPRAASAKVIGTFTVKSLPFWPNTGWGAMCTTT